LLPKKDFTKQSSNSSLTTATRRVNLMRLPSMSNV